MNYQFKALNLSLAMHIVLILILIGISNSLVVTNKLLVIDFTIGDSIKATEPSMSKKVKTDMDKNRHPVARKEKRNIQNNKTEVPPAPQHVATTEEPMPITTHDEKRTDSSAITENLTENVSMAAGSQGGYSTGTAIAKAQKEAVSYGYSGNSPEQGKIQYLKKHFTYIKDKVQRHITYPTFARRMGWKGKVTVSFIVSPTGHANEIHIVQSSGFLVLDQNAVAAVKRASPFPNPPVAAQVIIPILYQLN